MADNLDDTIRESASGPSRAGGSLLGYMRDAEADFRLGPLSPGSNTGTFGEPIVPVFEPRSVR